MKKVLMSVLGLIILLHFSCKKDQTSDTPQTATTILPASAVGDWSNAGVQGGIPQYPVGVNVLDYGATGDGTTDDTDAILDAIAACPEENALFFPAGSYLTTHTLVVSKPIVLRGAGPEQTHIIHNHSGNGIRLESGGDWAGIEDLHIETVWIFTGISGYKIRFRNVQNSWIKNIETSRYIGHAISLQECSHCEVRDSYIHNSSEMLDESLEQTSAYGIEVNGGDAGCYYNLVENNVLDWFRHAMILQNLCQHNVYAYNFAWNNWSCNHTGCGFSKTTDFELHHYDYDGNPPSKFITLTLIEGNLFEQGNSAQEVHQNNTWLRNRVNNGGIGVNTNNYVIGNELIEKKNPGTWSANIIKSLEGNSIAHGNYITDTDEPGIFWDPNIEDHTIRNSLYLSSKPAWFGNLEWPPYGGDLMPGNTRQIPAEVRYWTEIYPKISSSNRKTGH